MPQVRVAVTEMHGQQLGLDIDFRFCKVHQRWEKTTRTTEKAKAKAEAVQTEYPGIQTKVSYV
jgi:hypothetical protein